MKSENAQNKEQIRDPHILLTIVKITAIPIVLFFVKPRIYGIKNLKRQNGRLIAVSNHLSLWDPVLMDMLFYFRKVHFMAARDTMYTKSRLFSWFISCLGAFPVDRNAGDKAAYAHACGLLESGKVLMMTPEGRFNKTGELLSFHTGAIRMAFDTDTEILPVYIDRIPSLFHVTHIAVGERINMKELYGKDGYPDYDEFKELSEKLRADVADLRDNYCGKNAKK